jgi:hypothetical protein
VDTYRFDAAEAGLLLTVDLELVASYAFEDLEDLSTEAQRTKLDSRLELLDSAGAVVRAWDNLDGVLQGPQTAVLPSAVSLSSPRASW